MALKEKDRCLNLSFTKKVDGYNYRVFASSENMKCFGCGAEGHQIRSCPQISVSWKCERGSVVFLLPLQSRPQWSWRKKWKSYIHRWM